MWIDLAFLAVLTNDDSKVPLTAPIKPATYWYREILIYGPHGFPPIT